MQSFVDKVILRVKTTIDNGRQMKSNAKRLSVIIPVYNESRTITMVLEKVLGVRLPNRMKVEIWVVDDGSTDDTGKKVKRIIQSHPGGLIKYIRLDKNRGKGYAVRIGIALSMGDVIVIQDADMEYDPADYSLLLQPILSGEYKVVYGSRLLNKENCYSYPSFYWGGRFVSWVTGLLFGQKITDEPTCYKMFEAGVLKNIPLTCDGFGFCPEVTAKILRKGYTIKEVPISYHPRSKKEGKKIKWQDGMEAVYILIKYRWTKEKVTVAQHKKIPRKNECRFMKNAAFLLPVMLLTHFLFSVQPGYHWVYNGLLKENMRLIKKYPKLTFDQKMCIKLGASYEYLMFLKQATPDTAVILYPSSEAFQKEGSPFKHEIYNKIYATRFLYPRKLVLESELKYSKYRNKITHVAIVNREGIDRLPYPPDPKIRHTVLSVTPVK